MTASLPIQQCSLYQDPLQKRGHMSGSWRQKMYWLRPRLQSCRASQHDLVLLCSECCPVQTHSLRWCCSDAHPPERTTDWAPCPDCPAMPATCGKCAPHWRQSSRSFQYSPTLTPCTLQGHHWILQALISAIKRDALMRDATRDFPPFVHDKYHITLTRTAGNGAVFT